MKPGPKGGAETGGWKVRRLKEVKSRLPRQRRKNIESISRSVVPDSAIPWTVAPLSIEFSRQEYWSGLSYPSPGDLPDGTGLSYIAGRFFTVWSTRKALPRQRREASISLASTPSLFSGWILILIFRIHISVASRFSLFPSLDLISLFWFFLALTRCLQNLVSSIRDWTRATGCESARS